MTMIPVNSIEIPERFVRIAGDWYTGSGCMLYAVSSTGGLKIGTVCPVTDYDDIDDRDRKWYYSIWRDLSVNVGIAEGNARMMIDGLDGSPELEAAAELLEEFEHWVDEICDELSESYGLENWDG